MFGQEPFSTGNRLRFRIWPESGVGLSLVGKKPGAAWTPQVEELAFAQQGTSDMRPYDRLIGAALDGHRWLFAREETVEAAWRVVDPVLDDATPLHSYAQGSWGPKEADGLLPNGDAWHDPIG
jgi:glucose-6-phosphate 1-dehydrogenase